MVLQGGEEGIGGAAAAGVGVDKHVVEKTDFAATERTRARAYVGNTHRSALPIPGDQPFQHMVGIVQPAPHGVGNGVGHDNLVEIGVAVEQPAPIGLVRLGYQPGVKFTQRLFYSRETR